MAEVAILLVGKVIDRLDVRNLGQRQDGASSEQHEGHGGGGVEEVELDKRGSFSAHVEQVLQVEDEVVVLLVDRVGVVHGHVELEPKSQVGC